MLCLSFLPEKQDIISLELKKKCLLRLYMYIENLLGFYETWCKGFFGEGEYESEVQHGANCLKKRSQCIKKVIKLYQLPTVFV